MFQKAPLLSAMTLQTAVNKSETKESTDLTVTQKFGSLLLKLSKKT